MSCFCTTTKCKEQITEDWRIEAMEDDLLGTAPDESETFEHNVTITLMDT